MTWKSLQTGANPNVATVSIIIVLHHVYVSGRVPNVYDYLSHSYHTREVCP